MAMAERTPKMPMTKVNSIALNARRTLQLLPDGWFARYHMSEAGNDADQIHVLAFKTFPRTMKDSSGAILIAVLAPCAPAASKPAEVQPTPAPGAPPFR